MIGNPLYIFDLDGTIAMPTRRIHLLPPKGKGTDEQWHAFYDACDTDEPNVAVIKTLCTLHKGGADIYIWTGRSDRAMAKTVRWLFLNVPGPAPILAHMRKGNDRTPDNMLKKQWLNGMDQIDRDRLVAVFDDRDRVVKMWRDNRITCFQVAEGDF